MNGANVFARWVSTMTKVPKTPAFPFYGKDAYDDEAFAALSFAEQGLYLFLAWWQWQEGTIPADIERILDKVPRRKIAEARRCWVTIQQFFPVAVASNDRRSNGTVETHRHKVATDRAKNSLGAQLTNRKLGRGIQSLSDSLGVTVTDPNSDTLRAASANATAFGVVSPVLVGVQGEGGVYPPEMFVVQRIDAKFEASALDPAPPLQIVIALLTEFDEELIVETLADCEDQYRGKHWKYFEKILTNRRRNPNERPGNRRRASAGNGRRDSRTSGTAAQSIPSKIRTAVEFGGRNWRDRPVAAPTDGEVPAVPAAPPGGPDDAVH